MINRTQSRLIAKEKRNFADRRGHNRMGQDRRGHQGPMTPAAAKSTKR